MLLRSRIYLFSLIILLKVLPVYAQPYDVSGIIVNKATQEPIPFANIAIKDIYKGTATNLLGEFSFKIDSLPVTLIFSHLSYETTELRLEQIGEPLRIELDPGKLVMDEVVIEGRGNDEFAYKLVNKALYKIMGKGGINRYGKAFYRQISKNGDEYSELYEIFYDTRYSNNGVEDWAIQEGRYALKLSTADSFIYNKNFTLMVRLLTIVQPETDDLVVPVSKIVRDQYDLYTQRIISVNGRNVAVIRFNVKEEVTKPAMEGEMLIDVENANVLKLNGTVANDDLKFISLKGNTGSWKNYAVSCEIAFKPVGNEDDVVLEYMRLKQGFDYYVDGVFANKVETNSFFSYYEYYDPPKRKKLGGRLIRFNQRDSELLDAIGYDQRFWDENIIVKRTPIEAEVTRSFEEERAFGSIYLNNKNQIELEDYKIDDDPLILEVKSKLAEYKLPRLGEKVYLHLDLPQYYFGQEMWFKAYVVNMSTNFPSQSRKSLHINLYDPNGKLVNSNLFSVRDGKSYGKLELPPSGVQGYYTLEAYSDHMTQFDSRYYFTKEIALLDENTVSETLLRPTKQETSTLIFKPEGSNLINQMPGQVAFVATNRFGEAEDEIKGRIVDESGKSILSFKSQLGGFGSFFVLPQADLSYSNIVTDMDLELGSFPEINKSGYAVLVNNLKENAIDITVRGTMKMEGKKFYILILSNGVLFDRRVGALTRGLFKTEIPKSNLPNGIAQVLLVDKNGIQQNKRLIFNRQPDGSSVKYYLAKKDYRPRERVDMVIEVNDENGKPLSFSNISVSVLDKSKVVRSESAQNMRSYFMLDYLLDQHYPQSATLVDEFDRESYKEMDWIMLNQETSIPDITKKIDSSEESPTVRTHSIEGIAYNQERPFSNGYLSLVSYPDPSLGSWYITTDSIGRFNLDAFFIPDSINVVTNAIDETGKQVSVDLSITKSASDRQFEAAEVNLSEQYRQSLTYFRKSGKAPFRNYDKLVGRSKEEFQMTDTAPFGNPIQEFDLSANSSSSENLSNILNSRIPGLVGDKGENEFGIRLRGTRGEPIVLVDGVIVNQDIDLGGKSIVFPKEFHNRFSALPVSHVEKIEVYRNFNDQLFFGKAWENGVIAIFCKQEHHFLQNYESNLLKETIIPGYESQETFVSPEYSSNKTDRSVADNRSTIYWNPDITTNKKGRAKVSFYNSDEARTFQICIEGISQDGTPIFDLYEFGRNASKK